jgi:hypothetical protein
MKINDTVLALVGGSAIGWIAKNVFGFEFLVPHGVIVSFVAIVSLVVGIVAAILTWTLYDWTMSRSDFWHNSPLEYYSGKIWAAIFSWFLAGILTFWIMGYYFCLVSGLGTEFREGCQHEVSTNAEHSAPVSSEAVETPVPDPPQNTESVVPSDASLNPVPPVEQLTNEHVVDSLSPSADNAEGSTKEN